MNKSIVEHSFLDGIDVKIPLSMIEAMYDKEHGEFSFADVVERRLAVKTGKLPTLVKLRYMVDKMKELVETEDQDWVTIICGAEGSGKSNLAIQLASIFDPEFDIETQMVNSYSEDYSYMDYLKKYKDIKYKSVVFDEAVIALFSRESAKSGNINITKMFNMNRQLNHYSILTLPGFWSLEKDMRERRVRSLLYVFAEPKTRVRKYAYYSREKVSKIVSNPGLRSLFLSPKRFMNSMKPNFVEPFPKMDIRYRRAYLARKKSGFNEFFTQEMSNDKIQKQAKVNEMRRIVDKAEGYVNEKV